MTLRGRFADACAGLFCRAFGLRSPSRWSVRVAGELASMVVEAHDGADRYRLLANNPMLLWRAQTFLSKEPETIAWMRTFSAGEVLYDVGANVGLYSIFAGRRGAKVCAFEPEAANLATLNANIRLNGLGETVIAYPFAIAEKMTLDTLRLASVQTGAALHAFGSNIDFKGQPFAPVAQQGCLAVPIDDLVFRFGLPFPDYIKIDVDGLERQVLSGAARVIADPRLKGVLVEVNENEPADMEVIDSLVRQGLKRAGQGEAVRSGAARMRNLILSRGP